MVFPIIYEEKGDEDMAEKLRVGFKERQRKHLSESITVISHSAKKPYPEILCSKPLLIIAPALEPFDHYCRLQPSIEREASTK